MRPVLREIADILEQTFAIACIESLYPTANDRHAAIGDYRAEYRLTKTRMQDVLRSNLMRDIEERAKCAVLVRLYWRRRRVWDPDKQRPGQWEPSGPQSRPFRLCSSR